MRINCFRVLLIVEIEMHLQVTNKGSVELDYKWTPVEQPPYILFFDKVVLNEKLLKMMYEYCEVHNFSKVMFNKCYFSNAAFDHANYNLIDSVMLVDCYDAPFIMNIKCRQLQLMHCKAHTYIQPFNNCNRSLLLFKITGAKEWWQGMKAHLPLELLNCQIARNRLAKQLYWDALLLINLARNFDHGSALHWLPRDLIRLLTKLVVASRYDPIWDRGLNLMQSQMKYLETKPATQIDELTLYSGEIGDEYNPALINRLIVKASCSSNFNAVYFDKLIKYAAYSRVKTLVLQNFSFSPLNEPIDSKLVTLDGDPRMMMVEHETRSLTRIECLNCASVNELMSYLAKRFDKHADINVATPERFANYVIQYTGKQFTLAEL